MGIGLGMINVEILMTNQCPNDKWPMGRGLFGNIGHLGFVIDSSFVLRHWSFSRIP